MELLAYLFSLCATSSALTSSYRKPHSGRIPSKMDRFSRSFSDKSPDMKNLPPHIQELKPEQRFLYTRAEQKDYDFAAFGHECHLFSVDEIENFFKKFEDTIKYHKRDSNTISSSVIGERLEKLFKDSEQICDFRKLLKCHDEFYTCACAHPSMGLSHDGSCGINKGHPCEFTPETLRKYGILQLPETSPIKCLLENTKCESSTISNKGSVASAQKVCKCRDGFWGGACSRRISKTEAPSTLRPASRPPHPAPVPPLESRNDKTEAPIDDDDYWEEDPKQYDEFDLKKSKKTTVVPTRRSTRPPSTKISPRMKYRIPSKANPQILTLPRSLTDGSNSKVGIVIGSVKTKTEKQNLQERKDNVFNHNLMNDFSQQDENDFSQEDENDTLLQEGQNQKDDVHHQFQRDHLLNILLDFFKTIIPHQKHCKIEQMNRTSESVPGLATIRIPSTSLLLRAWTGSTDFLGQKGNGSLVSIVLAALSPDQSYDLRVTCVTTKGLADPILKLDKPYFGKSSKAYRIA